MTSPAYDAIVVGARCAGTTVATVLARAGKRVLLVDRDRFPSDVVSTHQLFPDALELLDRLGAGERLRASHELRPVRYRWSVLGHAVSGGFTPIGGHELTSSVRRIALDHVLVETALDAGAEVLLGEEVADLVGTGTEADPVRGVVLANGECFMAPWVIGADGRTSTVARRLGVPKSRELRGQMSMLFAYWTGLPDTGWCAIDTHEDLSLMSSPCEDGVHLLNVAGPVDFTRGDHEQREQAYADALRQFPSTLDPALLDGARRISDLVVVPETMMRGYERPAAGPGWALVGDAGFFSHPVTAQGIGEALAEGWYVGTAVAAEQGLDGFGDWRSRRTAVHHEWSFQCAVFPSASAAATYAGLAADEDAGREFLDTFTKGRLATDVLTRSRMTRWRAAWTYEQGLREVSELVRALDDEVLAQRVPACPDWSVRDLVAHLVGIAEDSARGDFMADALGAWRDPSVAERREEWTAEQVARRRTLPVDALLQALQEHGQRLVAALRAGRSSAGELEAWEVVAPVGDLAVHLADLREALGQPPAESSALARFGFALYRDWLGGRLDEQGLPALILRADGREWRLGGGEEYGAVSASAHELFRSISGRRSADHIRGLDWSTDAEPYLGVIAPYPLPA